MLLRTRPAFIAPCLPSAAERPPSGPGWFHEIKLEGYVSGVRLLTRNGLDWTRRYPGIAAAVGELRCRSCLLDGEIVICGEDGIPVFDRLRYGQQVKGEALLYAFDLLGLDGRDLRREAIEIRKAMLAKLLHRAPARLQINEPHRGGRRCRFPARLQARISQAMNRFATGFSMAAVR